jgi:hypothetical protein
MDPATRVSATLPVRYALLVPRSRAMALYDAFISYSHSKDKPIAAALQAKVQTLGKPWYRRRALRVFRDDTSLSATPSLWPSIEEALGQSRFLILLASPEAAASPWVGKEVAFWLEHKGPGTLLIALTDGELVWDNAAGDFRGGEGGPLPPALAGRFAAEPKWVDLCAYRAGADPRDDRFTELAADFAAAIHGMPRTCCRRNCASSAAPCGSPRWRPWCCCCLPAPPDGSGGRRTAQRGWRRRSATAPSAISASPRTRPTRSCSTLRGISAACRACASSRCAASSMPRRR